MIRPDDFARFQALGVIASVQPTHATSDKNMVENRIGSERIKGAYAWNRLLENKRYWLVVLTFLLNQRNPLYSRCRDSSGSQ